MIKNDKWHYGPIDESDFSAVAMSNVNFTWIQLPGLHVQDKYLLLSKVEITASADTPPSLTLRRIDGIDSDVNHTTFEKFKLLNITKLQLLKGSQCRTQVWIAVAERRCINITQHLPQGHAIVVMRQQPQKEVTMAIVKVGTKEYLFFHYQIIKMEFDWNKIPLDSAFRINLTDAIKPSVRI
jgi:hypothetical protein